MSNVNDWNQKIIAEFRGNEGQVGGQFEGAPIVLVHHRGRRSGQEYVNPVVYLPDAGNDDKVYVFASKAGAPTNPDWYYNLTEAGEGTVERGTETYRVSVRELSGDERDRTYDEHARRFRASSTTRVKPRGYGRSRCWSSHVPGTLKVVDGIL